VFPLRGKFPKKENPGFFAEKRGELGLYYSIGGKIGKFNLLDREFGGVLPDVETLGHTKPAAVMWKIRKFSLQSVLELMTTRMIDELHTN